MAVKLLSWWTNDSSHSMNIWDTVTNAVPKCLVHQLHSYEPNFILPAWVSQNRPISACYLFLSLTALAAVQTNSIKTTCWSEARLPKLGDVYDGAWYIFNTTVHVPRLWQYHYYSWNEANFWSTMIISCEVQNSWVCRCRSIHKKLN